MRNFIFVCAFICFVSCHHHQQPDGFTIDIRRGSITEANITEIAKHIKAIPLETTQESLLANTFTINKHDSLLFVLSNERIYRFGIDGKFHKRLTNRGQGPGEIDVLRLDFDKKNETIVIIGSGNRILHINYDGTPIKATRFSGDRIIDFAIFNDYFWAIVNIWNRPGFFDLSLLQINRDWEVLDTIKLHTSESGFTEMFMVHQHLSAVDGDLFFNYPSAFRETIGRDTLFRITGSELYPVLRVDQGVQRVLHRQGWQLRNGDLFVPDPISKLNGRFLTANFLQASQQPGGGSHRYQFWYDFVTGKQYLLRGGFTDNVYQTGQVLLRRFGLLSDKLYFFKWPHELDESPLEREDEDNPIVFIVTLKE